jgi:hypothetical protein
MKWVGENTPKPATKIGFGSLNLGPTKAAGIIVLSADSERLARLETQTRGDLRSTGPEDDDVLDLPPVPFRDRRARPAGGVARPAARVGRLRIVYRGGPLSGGRCRRTTRRINSGTVQREALAS